MIFSPNTFCWWGLGYCVPEAEPVPELVEPIVEETSGFSLFDSGPLIVQIKSHAHSLDYNLDILLVLVMCTIMSSLVSALVIYWLIMPGLKKIQDQPAAAPVTEAYDLRKTKSELEDDDEGGNKKSNPNQISILDSLFDPVEGFYKPFPAQVPIQPDISLRKIPIISTASFIPEPIQVIFKKISGFIIEEPKPEKSEEKIKTSPSVSSNLVVLEKLQRESKVKLEKVPSEKLVEGQGHQNSDIFVLTLHQYPRGRSIPCMAPHGMKIESLLRLSEIPHRVVFDANNSTGPWLSYGDLKVCGSVQMCIKFLNQTFPRKMNGWTVPAKKKIPAWFVTLLADCHLYWGLNLWRWLIDDARKEIDPNQCENDVMWGETRETIEKMRVAGWLPGIGDMSQEEIIEAVKNDLVCLAASLGNKKYFIGDSITDVDVAAFSLLSQMVYSSSELPFQKLIKAYPNLIRFCDHIRKDLWGDWNSLILDPESQVSAAHVSEETENAFEPKVVKATQSVDGHGSRSNRHRSSRQNPHTRFTDKISVKTAGPKRRSRSSRSKSRHSKQPVVI